MSLTVHTLRLLPGADLRRALSALPVQEEFSAGFILAAVGSLSRARLRLAGAETEWEIEADLDILTLSGTLSLEGAHLHVMLADGTGSVVGGHVMEGCEVRTTAEIVVGIASDWVFHRAIDPATGFPELEASRR